jgi:hypothetical protein
MEDDPEPLLSRLHKEKLATQARRGALISRKLTWVSGLVAIGWIRLAHDLNLWLILYVVPFVGILVDLYIIGEDYAVKRMGAFVQWHLPKTWDGKWEANVSPQRDKFSQYALPLGSFTALLASAAGIWVGHGSVEQLTTFAIGSLVWFAAASTFIGLVFVLGLLSRRRLNIEVQKIISTPEF